MCIIVVEYFVFNINKLIQFSQKQTENMLENHFLSGSIGNIWSKNGWFMKINHCTGSKKMTKLHLDPGPRVTDFILIAEWLKADY